MVGHRESGPGEVREGAVGGILVSRGMQRATLQGVMTSVKGHSQIKATWKNVGDKYPNLTYPSPCVLL